MKMKKYMAPIVASFALFTSACGDEEVAYLSSVKEELPGANCADGGSS